MNGLIPWGQLQQEGVFWDEMANGVWRGNSELPWDSGGEHILIHVSVSTILVLGSGHGP